MNRVTAIALSVLSVMGCHRGRLPAGVAPGLSPEMVPYRGARDVRSLVHSGLERISYSVDVPYPAREVIRSVAGRMASRGWKPLRTNWFNRDEASEFLRGWVQFTVVNKPDGKERYLCRWWAQWRNASDDIVDYWFQYLSVGEAFTNRSQLYVLGSKSSAMVSRRSLLPGIEEKGVFELPSETPPNVETATDNSPDPRVFHVRPDGVYPLPTPPTSPASASSPLSPYPPSSAASLFSLGSVVLQQTTDLDGTSYTYSISRQMAETTPDWWPDRGDPPLSMSRATSIAKKEAHRRHTGVADFKVVSISLQGMSCHPIIPDKWFYMVYLHPITTRGEESKGVWQLILLDGTVVEPTQNAKDGEKRPAS